MILRRGGLMMAAVAVVMMSGCDRPSTPSAPKSSAARTAAIPKPISLVAAPLLATVPVGWTTQESHDGNFVFLRGPAPSGDVQILVAMHGSTDEPGVTALVDAARRDQAAHEDQIPVTNFDIRGSLRTLEKVIVDRAATTSPAVLQSATTTSAPAIVIMPGTLPSTGSMLPPDARVTWSVLVFIPRGDRLDQCLLEVLGLTVESYAADKDVLQSIFKSVEYDASWGAGPTIP